VFRNEKLISAGTAVFDYIIITMLLFVSLMLVIPFVPVYVGVARYLAKSNNERTLRIIFETIKQNIRILFQFSLLFTVLITSIILNLFVLDDSAIVIAKLMEWISYIGLFILLHIIINAPMIIIEMKVTLRELVVNSIHMVFVSFKEYLVLFIIVLIWLYSISISYLSLVFGIYFVVLIIAKTTNKNIKKIKEKMT
jgi:hypothetical protein